MPRLSEHTPLIHETAIVETTRMGRYVEIDERCRVAETEIGDYSYMMRDCGVWGTTIGKFVNIAASARLNATNHPVERATLHHFTYRANDYFDDAEEEAPFFAARRWTVLERASAPPALQASTEFAGLCPASAVCMAKGLGGASGTP